MFLPTPPSHSLQMPGFEVLNINDEPVFGLATKSITAPPITMTRLCITPSLSLLLFTTFEISRCLISADENIFLSSFLPARALVIATAMSAPTFALPFTKAVFDLRLSPLVFSETLFKINGVTSRPEILSSSASFNTS